MVTVEVVVVGVLVDEIAEVLAENPPIPKDEKMSRVALFYVLAKTVSKFPAPGCSQTLVSVLNQFLSVD